MKHGSLIKSLKVNGRVWNKTSTIALQEKVQTQPSLWKLMLTVFWDSQGPVLEHYEERVTTIYSALAQWDAYWQAEACNSKQTPRTTVEMCCVVARQCLSTYFCPHCWNAPETQVWSNGSSSVQSWSCPVWQPLVWSTQRGIKGLSIHVGPRSEGNGACVDSCSAENLLFGGHQEDQMRWKTRGLCWKMMLM